MRFLPSSTAAMAFALAAMLLRALLPDGWMPDSQAARFTICSVANAHHDSGKPSQREQEHRHAPCAFAAAAPLAPPAITALAVGTASTKLTAFADTGDQKASSGSTYPPNAARAPPAFA